MIKSFLLIFSLLVCLVTVGQDEIDYQNKRLINGLKKSGVSDFSQLEELNLSSENQYEPKGKFFKVTENLKASEIKYVYVGRVNSCRAGGCSNSGISTPQNLDSEYFDYYIFFDAAKTVKQVEVYNYAATHGYEITAKGWLKQFVGFAGKDTLLVNKDIDGITGATVSVYAITTDIQQKTRLLKTLN
ncbi:MAG TPA: FMN-binding protein [Draconibacterium sp.]|nr:FMN-binding protein [Draconibacterium sp.]